MNIQEGAVAKLRKAKSSRKIGRVRGEKGGGVTIESVSTHKKKEKNVTKKKLGRGKVSQGMERNLGVKVKKTDG